MHNFPILLLALLLFVTFIANSHQQDYIQSKSLISTSYSTNGFYDLKVEGSCELSIGYIQSFNSFNSLKVAPYYSPKFKQLASAKTYSGQVMASGSDHYFVVFNNNSVGCYGSISTTKQEYNVAKTEASMTLQYSKGSSFNHANTQAGGANLINSFKITSKSSNPMVVGASVDGGTTFNSIAIKANENVLVKGDDLMLRCEYTGGCPVTVSYMFFSGANSSINMKNGLMVLVITILMTFISL